MWYIQNIRTGLPIYNVLALNYTPLLAKRPPMKRKRHTWCLEWRKTSTPESVAQDEALNAPEKKQKLGDAKQDKQVHLDCRSNSVQTSTAPRSELPGANSCVTVSSRKQRKLCSVEKSLLAINNRRKKHRRRKRLVSCLKRQTNGKFNQLIIYQLMLLYNIFLGTNSLSSAERYSNSKPMLWLVSIILYAYNVYLAQMCAEENLQYLAHFVPENGYNVQHIC